MRYWFGGDNGGVFFYDTKTRDAIDFDTTRLVRAVQYHFFFYAQAHAAIAQNHSQSRI